MFTDVTRAHPKVARPACRVDDCETKRLNQAIDAALAGALNHFIALTMVNQGYNMGFFWDMEGFNVLSFTRTKLGTLSDVV
jgi:hypothetical protein